jgi:hypothetical protein
MKVYDEELDHWFKLRSSSKSITLTPLQLKLIDQKSKDLLKQTLSHPHLHNLLGILLIAFLLFVDIYSATLKGPTGLIILGLVHGYILYALTVYTMHEGAGHKRIIIGNRPLALLANNVSRLFFADPLFYQQNHPSHHQCLGTKDDKAFTQLVLPQRILKSFLPGAGLLKFNDYKIHTGDEWTNSKILSLVLGLSYTSFLIFLSTQPLVPLIIILLIVSPWIGMTLDRLRESSEHLLVVSQDLPEARELGNTFWGYLIGGGPWGQPCHLSHHIAPALPWYQQLRLSHTLKNILTPEQKAYFFVNDGILEYPKLFIKLMKTNALVFKQKV